ncbi:Gldg family protein [Rapidithrix thailandica]|uniref:Gldg family protein n=1 Tax=Rapidithrix thailandica TaxID=413964 RepID=A0AAW9RX60_9BACT
MLTKRNIITKLGLLTAIIVLVNLIASKAFLRLDFTADQRYTLDKATKDILSDLEEVITIKAYFSEDLPPQLLSNRQDFKDLLIEYENRSGSQIVYEFINPNEDEAAEQKAQQTGISPLLINVQDRDQVKQMRAYMGAVVETGDRKEILPVIQPGAAMEYDLTTAIKKLTVVDKPKVAFLQGHGEPSMYASQQVVQQLSVLFEVEPYTLSDTAEIPAFYKAIAWVSPQDTVPDSHLMKLDNYLKTGGSIYLAYSGVQGNLQSNSLTKAPDIGLKGWLEDKGIHLGSNFVIDVSCGSVSVQQQQGPFVFNTQVEFPYFPMIAKFADHPVSKGLESLFLPFVSDLQINQDTSNTLVTYTPLAFTSERSGLVPAPAMLDINREWTAQDFNQTAQPVAVALEGQLVGNTPSKIVMIANGQFAVNGAQGNQAVNPDNVNFTVNAIDWLADDTGLIDLRTKGVTSRPLDPLEEDTKAFLSYANVLAPIALIILYGMLRRQQYLNKRRRWMEGNI